ncbi:WD repeat-containing protein 19 [Histomonas meleagridis]|uniref:WD repeat-containing protein 19 n=1 Tax=Histomonas meleagridis TaxID=135588 RepID=UPI003559FCEF|nr:WD repeat-containing protein 19 [Histomonas meleagridis]KAH0806232.1 WD repeat-containing protein 19 [Histomonas meleagridis]
MQLVFKVDQNEIGRNSSPTVCWSRDSKMVACFGSKNQVLIYDRNGSKFSTVPIESPKLMSWDSDNKALAIASKGISDITLFNLMTREIDQVEAPFEPTWISFSRSGSYLAAGSDKGKFWIWERNSGQAQTYQGTHCGRITDGIWNTKKQLALCSDDHSVSINSVRGEVIARHEINDTPAFPHFIRMDQQMHMIFAGTNKPVIYIWEYSNNKVTEIPFDTDLGTIIKCLTLSSGYIFVQFSTGKLSLVGFDGEIATDRQVFTTITNKADAVHSKALICSGSSMKQVNLGDPKNITDDQIRFPSEFTGEVTTVLLSPDGTCGAVGISCGVVLIYLVEVPILTATKCQIAVYSDSLTTLIISDMHRKKTKKITIETQPQKLAICQTKLAVAFNNQCWFYDINNGSLLSNIELSSSVDSIQISDNAYAVLMSGKVMLTYFDQSKKPFIFPDSDIETKVTTFALAEYLLLIATDDGKVRMFNIQTESFVDGYKHPSTILSVSGTSKTIDCSTTLFDISDRNVFVTIGNKSVAIYHFTDQNVLGPQLKQIGHTNISSMKSALCLSNGNLTYLDSQSNEQTQIMPSHNEIENESEKAVLQLLNLQRNRKALQIALKLNNKELIKKVGQSSLDSLCVEIASEAFSQCGDASMRNVLQPIVKEREYSFLKGYVSMMNNDFGSAQKNFLESSRPQMALDMRASLLQFDYALKLAETLDPSRIPQLSHDSARQNELTGNYSLAIKQYKESIRCKPYARSSRDGIIRCLILAGKVEQGMQQLAKIKDVKLITECANILEKLSAFTHAAQLYVRVGEYNLAAQCYVRANEIKSATDLIPKVTDTKVLRSIGLQLERIGNLESAATAFEKSNDWESLVRVLLKINLDKAANVAREHPIISVCRLVAEHCIQLNNFRYAIEFMIRANRSDDAFRIAELHNKMDEFADLISDSGTQQQYEAIATYFCNRNDMIQAAKFFEKANNPMRALNCYISDGSDKALDGALDLAERIKDREIYEQLFDFLNANIRDKNKDLRYLLRMFIIMQRYDEASQTAIQISEDLRANGEYRASRDLLFDVMKQLQKHNYNVSAEMKKSLMIVHSYLLIKPMKEKNKVITALLLRRLSEYVNKFPKHSVNLLVMGVVECSRAGMKKSAFKIATKLLQPEYEGQLKQDMLRKIQTTVRRKDTSEIEEEKTKCPVCGFDLPISELVCTKCKTSLPFDAATGMHMTREDWCECPKCGMPSSFALMQQDKKCMLCGEEVPNPQLIVNPKIN